jgi:hypothetical protein
MEFRWIIGDEDSQLVRRFIEKHKEKKFVRARLRRNVEGPVPPFSKDIFWRSLVMCLLTTQQRSGPESAVTRFLTLDPFPLSLAECRANPDTGHFERILTRAGLWRSATIRRALQDDLKVLDGGGWPYVEEFAKRLGEQRAREPRPSDKSLEREAAAAVDDGFEGIGPKQSRNLWQSLGLTRYEIPLDSRITKWLAKSKFPLSVSSILLSDGAYYNFVLDGVQLLCEAAEALPCVLDGAVFASYDPEWDDSRLIL